MAYQWILEGDKAIPSLVSSLIVVSISTALALFFGTMAGYAFSRFLISGAGEKLSFWVLTTRMFPPVIIAFPLYYLYTGFNLIDTYFGLILTYLVFNLPLSTWLMKTYFDDVPLSYEEAAYINGYSVFKTFWKVTLPLIQSGLISAGILCWIFVWGEFLFAVVLTGAHFTTYPALIPTLSTGFNIQWNNIMALSTIAMIPPIIFLFLLRKKLVSGLSLGAVKLH
jgi:multiple sugar transport system permease protein